MNKTAVWNFRKQRIRELNKRLNSLKAADVRSYFLKQGYYPEEQYFPSDFFNSSGLEKVPRMTGYIYDKKGNFIQKNIPKSNFAAPIYYPQTPFAKMVMKIPPVLNYVYFADFIEKNWTFFRSRMLLDEKKDLIIPYSYPLFYDGEKRSDIGINNYKQFYEFDIRSFTHLFEHLVIIDVKNFYSSIYTHAIAWAIDDKTKKGKYHNDLKLKANQFDLILRRLDGNKTKGIPVGPITSDFSSELLLKKIDSIFSKRMRRSKYKFIAGRFKDDYIFLCGEQLLANKVVSEMHDILSDFHLDINESKTAIIQNFFENDIKIWKVETNTLRNEISEVQKNSNKYIKYNEQKISLWLRKTKDLHKRHGDPYIINSILGKIVNPNIGVEAISIDSTLQSRYPYKREISQAYIAVFENILDLCKSSPRSWPFFFVFIAGCLDPKNPHCRLITKQIIKYLKLLVRQFAESKSDFPLLWGLYILWRLNLKPDLKTSKIIKKKYKNNWAIMTFFYKKHQKCIIKGKRYHLIVSDRSKLKKLFELVNVFTYREFISYI